MKKYAVDYFIKKFKAIPKKKWSVGAIVKTEEGATCVLGHCGGYITPEAKALEKLMRDYLDCEAVSLNDNHIVEWGDSDLAERYSPFKHPKTRILAALECIKLGMKV